MRQVAPPGQATLPAATVDALRELTAELLAARPEAPAEHRRFAAVRHRAISPPGTVVPAVAGRVVLVTGGTGCVGRQLLHHLAALRPARLVSLAHLPPGRPVPGVRYELGDVRDRALVRRVLAHHRPSLVFHLAAQRDPGRAEAQPADALATNLIGTRNVLAEAERTGVRRLVYASTGKAMRPYTPDVYAGSKRLGEGLVARAAARGTTACSAVRFTHVVDNSIIARRLRLWCERGDVVRLHAADTMFYVQSARESAQLLLTALTAPADDVYRMYTIRDLGWPVSLLDLALGVMAAQQSIVPLYVAGPEPGYEPAAYPGLFDPRYAGGISPLINALEAPYARPSTCPEVDVVTVPRAAADWPVEGLADLDDACRTGDAATARRLHRRLCALALTAAADAAAPATLRRVTRLTEPHRPSMPVVHRLIDDAFRTALARHDPARALAAPTAA
ncbi:polysaccharide biosynthesis protein [Paractinoplanes abujensis]|uniref:Nucleoside-diphosphate-sugar epimerase n=1 Tax=Paractinoplanes abujensis TaxID=882441 RepID=A0A7W7CU24_9ACTN|nr:polysaccharide biosynthesis protein [Actinoplanes abujensis]MBB4693380.1 nucleoside-diphosphate-sugar epimerase [Actinoplanes abujensis]